MINTKPTKTHEKHINQHKKLFEKWDMWDFAYFYGKEYYFLTLYEQLLKGITGYLILDYKGNVVPLEQAKPLARSLVSFNTMIHGAMKEMVPQMLKNMSPFKEVVSLLSQHKMGLVSKYPELELSIDKVIHYTTYALGNPKRIEDFINTLGHLQRFATREHGYFDDEILSAMKDECVKYNAMMYEYGLNEFSLMDDYQQIINRLGEKPPNIPASSQKNLMNLLKSAMRSNNGTLKKTMKGFEDGFNEESPQLDLSNLIKSFDDKMNIIGSKDFIKKIIPKIRNPK